ncbi:bifunctional phosphopantothenoylcysteine decarboxylase/phosphopantothenate--cysteine ligase CoaBC [Xiamenia xianingshaonis]|uniref:Coenzyme A biosynthesis bifunctional protein CoaBC n=1 Tax=Xiamenia xianingshaonis TaxID=2682776 RepID=A0A9E6STP7_9ACTN|nr:bifunctional phosphopantothenoylcysteine decarboxylase/phosphopantothenate--cysteine ligase CoaBC [Xiamenia xianingshaonis]NHM13786.1 bifunctional phosphopantothenoylcysteine decarboxylase/phosphopantothenate--cysteine ligase CoaBC [Xiamenia xianingshaonis]NHM16218.1 bifunctional phosphopantothenoylcysteine decarboxylase/phosphopantothenate--cysteine ligase CoaBC [Xiamenia xianingshaonis]QTU83648.1 bifunctional phosphopantothenoylcysteine decarboxylase/phosphopantothenate--cysteine ligase Coa
MTAETVSSIVRKTAVVGVTGCIAAYKTCEIIRGLQKAGVRVKVVMTEHATKFVDPVTFRALTHEEVAIDLFDDPTDPIHHISLAEEADAFLVAPCTANVAAKMAHGIADDLLTTTALATTAPVLIAPAMNVHMYQHPATRANLGLLQSRGAIVIEAEDGYLACGEIGPGRLADPAAIVDATLSVLGVRNDLEGLRVLITAGPTVEPIDPVRYISNYSSGKSGYALAVAAARRGAQVTLVSGPTSLDPPKDVCFIGVRTAVDMLAACQRPFEKADIAIFAAAVADMRPATAADHKLKKGVDDDALAGIPLVKNPDVLATLAAQKDRQVVVGYAAETDDILENARRKLKAKHADVIVANDVGEGKAFNANDNKIWFVDEEGAEELPRMTKAALADVILNKALDCMR